MASDEQAPDYRTTTYYDGTRFSQGRFEVIERAPTWDEGHHCHDCHEVIYSDETAVRAVRRVPPEAMAVPVFAMLDGEEDLFHPECFDGNKSPGDPGYVAPEWPGSSGRQETK